MQVVGRSCELCEKRIASELDGVGCEACKRFFHDACLTAPPPVKEKPETYREPVEAKSAPKKKTRKRRPLCPGCGTDLRADQDARNRDTAMRADAYEESRRLAATAPNAQFPYRLAIRLGIFVLVGLVALVRLLLQ